LESGKPYDSQATGAGTADFFDLATEIENNEAVRHFQDIAGQLEVVIPVSFFEKKNQA
jgi:N-carbamoylputrescine amidase